MSKRTRITLNDADTKVVQRGRPMTFHSIASAQHYLLDRFDVSISRRTIQRRLADGTLNKIKLDGRSVGEVEIVLLESELDALAAKKLGRAA